MTSAVLEEFYKRNLLIIATILPLRDLSIRLDVCSELLKVFDNFGVSRVILPVIKDDRQFVAIFECINLIPITKRADFLGYNFLLLLSRPLGIEVRLLLVHFHFHEHVFQLAHGGMKILNLVGVRL